MPKASKRDTPLERRLRGVLWHRLKLFRINICPTELLHFCNIKELASTPRPPFLLCLCCRLQLPIDEFRERRVRCAKLLDMLISFSISPRAEPDGFCMKVDIGRHR